MLDTYTYMTGGIGESWRFMKGISYACKDIELWEAFVVSHPGGCGANCFLHGKFIENNEDLGIKQNFLVNLHRECLKNQQKTMNRLIINELSRVFWIA